MESTTEALDRHVPNPLVAAAARKLVQADANAAAGKVARWLPDEHCWLVPSSRDGEPPKRVTRRAPAAERVDPETGSVASRRPNKGYWWFILTCDCEAAQAGFAVCWHKAATFRWWQKHRRVDGDAYGDLPAHSPVGAHANGDVDPDGVERYKDKSETPERRYDEREWARLGMVGCNPDCEGCSHCRDECTCVSCDMDRQGVPRTSPDVDFDWGGPGEVELEAPL